MGSCSGSRAVQQFVGQRNGMTSERPSKGKGSVAHSRPHTTHRTEARPVERASEGPRGPRVK